MKQPPFPEVLETVKNDVIRAASDYTLITQLFFPILNQPEIENRFPWLVPNLYYGITGHIIMTVGRLFEVTDDRRTACVWTFLAVVEPHHAQDVDVRPHLLPRRTAFFAEIDGWRAQIKGIYKQLSLRRNADLAHNDLTKVGKSDIKWVELKEMIALGEHILRRYYGAFYASDQKFIVINAEWEIPDFLKWTRLDDYSAHRAKEAAVKKAAFDEWLRRRSEGDPTVPDRPPTE